MAKRTCGAFQRAAGMLNDHAWAWYCMDNMLQGGVVGLMVQQSGRASSQRRVALHQLRQLRILPCKRLLQRCQAQLQLQLSVSLRQLLLLLAQLRHLLARPR